MKIENVMFDLDGTLIDSAGDIVECLEAAFRAAEVTERLPIVRARLGPPLAEIIAAVAPGLDRETTDRVIGNFRKLYDNSRFRRTHLKVGVSDTLDHLCKRGKGVFLVTNKPALPTKKIIEKLNVDVFTDIMTPDARPGSSLGKADMIRILIGRWKLDRGSTLMVGDSASDVHAARDNGIRAAAVTDGYGDAEDIIRSKPDYVLIRCDAIIGLTAQ